MAAFDPAVDYYKVLQVDPAAEAEVIEGAYKRLALKYHPDTSTSEDATERMQAINVAYNVLKDAAKRAEYDQKRAAANVAPAPAPATPPQAASSPVAERARQEEAERVEAMRVVTEDRLRQLQEARLREAERQAEEERQRRGETPPAENASIWTAQDYTIMQNMPEAMRPPAADMTAKAAKPNWTQNPAMQNSAVWKLQDWQQDLRKRATGTFRAANLRTVEQRIKARNRTQRVVAVVVIAVIVVMVAALAVFALLGMNP